MLTKGKIGLGVVFGILCLAIASAGVLEAMRLEDRDLTDAEMGAIFGKQPIPNPNPLCSGCVWDGFILTPDCVADDPCANCRISWECPTYSYQAIGTLFANKVRSPMPPEPTNDDVKVRRKNPCRVTYQCLSIYWPDARCPGENSECVSSDEDVCKECYRGNELAPDPTDDETCISCPG